MSEHPRNDDTESEEDDDISIIEIVRSSNVLSVYNGSSENSTANRIRRFQHIPIVSSLLRSGVLEEIFRSYYNFMPNVDVESNHTNIVRFSNTLPPGSLLSFLTPEYLSQILFNASPNTTTEVSSVSNNASSSSSSSSLGILELVPPRNNDTDEPEINPTANPDITIRAQHLETLQVVEIQDWSRRLNVLRDSSGAFLTARWERIRQNNFGERTMSESDLDELNQIIPETIRLQDVMNSSMMTNTENQLSQVSLLDGNSGEVTEDNDDTIVEDATAPSSTFMPLNVVTFDNRSMLVNVGDDTLSTIVSNRHESELDQTPRRSRITTSSSPLSSNYVTVEHYFATVRSIDSAPLSTDSTNTIQQILEEDSINEFGILSSSDSSNYENAPSSSQNISNISQQSSEGHLVTRVPNDFTITPSFLENLHRELEAINYGDFASNSRQQISVSRSSSTSSTNINDVRRAFHAINIGARTSLGAESMNSSSSSLNLDEVRQAVQASNDSDSSQQISQEHLLNIAINEITINSSSSSSNLEDIRREFQAINEALENEAVDSPSLSCFDSSGSVTVVQATSDAVEINSAFEETYDDKIEFVKQIIISFLNEYLTRTTASLQATSSDEDDQEGTNLKKKED